MPLAWFSLPALLHFCGLMSGPPWRLGLSVSALRLCRSGADGWSSLAPQLPVVLTLSRLALSGVHSAWPLACWCRISVLRSSSHLICWAGEQKPTSSASGTFAFTAGTDLVCKRCSWSRACVRVLSTCSWSAVECVALTYSCAEKGPASPSRPCLPWTRRFRSTGTVRSAVLWVAAFTPRPVSAASLVRHFQEQVGPFPRHNLDG